MQTVQGLLVAVSLFAAGPLATTAAPSQVPASADSQQRVFAAEDIPTTEALPRQCVRITGADIGALPLVLDVDGAQVRFNEWVAADITGESLVGFHAEADGRILFKVEAGGDVFADTTLNWLNPHGVVGPNVHGIDALTLCRALVD